MLILGAYIIAMSYFARLSVIRFCSSGHAHMLSINRVPERSGGM